jgi:hypothetical protein
MVVPTTQGDALSVRKHEHPLRWCIGDPANHHRIDGLIG